MEQEDLAQSLSLVKDVIGAVDSKVASYEKKVRLNEIYTKTDSKSIMRMKSGQMFAKEDLKRKKLVRDGSVFLKNAAGRLKGKAWLFCLSVCPGTTGKIQVLLLEIHYQIFSQRAHLQTPPRSNKHLVLHNLISKTVCDGLQNHTK